MCAFSNRPFQISVWRCARLVRSHCFKEESNPLQAVPEDCICMWRNNHNIWPWQKSTLLKATDACFPFQLPLTISLQFLTNKLLELSRKPTTITMTPKSKPNNVKHQIDTTTPPPKKVYSKPLWNRDTFGLGLPWFLRGNKRLCPYLRGVLCPANSLVKHRVDTGHSPLDDPRVSHSAWPSTRNPPNQCLLNYVHPSLNYAHPSLNYY